MAGSGRAREIAALVLAALALFEAGATAQSKPAAPPVPGSSGNYDEIFRRYLAEAREMAARAPAEPWSWMGDLVPDPHAHRLNDILTINVVENIVATGSVDNELKKASSGNISVPTLFGLTTKLPSAIDPTSLASTKNATQFAGTGTTNRAGQLTAQLAARIADVLPNGDLVLEGVREIEINGDHQIIVMTGVVRVADISPTNVVQSTSISDLRIRYFGQGFTKDTLKPGWLIRVLNKMF